MIEIWMNDRENRQCGNCQHSYSLWDSELQKLATRCIGQSKEMPDGGLIMINKIVNWTDKPCENYKPWGVPTGSRDESDN